MAGSRMEKLGTIFDRVTALLKCGAMKRDERPLWYDVYQVFPPITAPSFSNVRDKPEIKQIFYPEDKIRAKFHQKMFRSLPTEDLMKETTTDVTRRAIDLTNKLMLENEKLTLDDAVDQMINIFKKDGLFVVRRSMKPPRISGQIPVTETQTKIENVSAVDGFEYPMKNISDKKIDVASLMEAGKDKKEES